MAISTSGSDPDHTSARHPTREPDDVANGNPGRPQSEIVSPGTLDDVRATGGTGGATTDDPGAPERESAG